MDGTEARSPKERNGGQEGLKREKVHGKGARARPNLRLGRVLLVTHFVVILLWLVLRMVLLQEQAYTPALCSLSAESYRQLTTHTNPRRMNASVRRSAPVPGSLKRNLFMSPMKEL